MSMGDLYLNPEIFADPHLFNPERWLSLSPKQKARMSRYFVPFSKGSRNCIGIELAKMSLLLTAGNVFNQLDLELFETTERDVKMVHDYFAPFSELGARGVRVLVR